MARARVLIAALVAVVVGLLVYRIVPRPLAELTRAEFLSEVRNGHVRRIQIDADHIITGTSTTLGPFRVMSPANEPELLAELRARGIEITYEKSALGLI